MERIGKYEVQAQIGEGGMGVVYRAFDPYLERTVALKLLLPQFAADAEFRERFFREARSAARLKHPNVVAVYDLGEERGRPYLAMEYLEGEDLRAEIAAPRRSLEEKLRIMLEVCRGLGYAHARGVVHRDVKPGNIFVTRTGAVKILDFGLARAVSADATQTVLLGTPAYMAPEQWRESRADPLADVFAAGAVFYELLARRRAFAGDTYERIFYHVSHTPPEPLERVDPALPPELSAILGRALAKSVAQRCPSIGELARDLEGFLPVLAARKAGLETEARSALDDLDRLVEDEAEVLADGLGPDSLAHAGARPALPDRYLDLVALVERARRERAALVALIETRRRAAPRLAEAARLAENGDLENARGILAEIVEQDPAGFGARAMLDEVERGLAERKARKAAPRPRALRGATALLALVAVAVAVVVMYRPWRAPSSPPPESERAAPGTGAMPVDPSPPARAVLEIRAGEPSVHIAIDGAERGLTGPDGTATIRDVPAGRHTLSLFKEGFAEWKEPRDLALGQTTLVERPLARSAIDPGRALLRVTSDPPDAGIVVEGRGGKRSDGITAGGSLTLPDLDPGPARVRIDKAGYEPADAVVQLTAGKSTLHAFRLTARPAVLALITAPPVAGAAVRINASEIGRTDASGALRASLAPGKGLVLEVAAEGYERDVRVLELAPGVTAPVQVELAARAVRPTTATVSVVSTPSDAEVLVDDRAVARTPANALLLAPGKHRIAVRKEGYRAAQQSVELSAGTVYSYPFPLEPQSGFLELSIEPRDATATIAGRTYPPPFQSPIALAPGDYAVELAKPGFKPKERRISITDQKTTVLHETLARSASLAPLSDSFSNLGNWDNPAGWRVERDGLRARGPSTVLLKDPPFASFRARVNLRLTNSNSASLLVRAQDARNYYRIQLSGDAYPESQRRNKVSFFAARDGRETEISSVELPIEPKRLRDFFDLLVDVIGSRITVRVSGMLLSGRKEAEAELGRMEDPENLYPEGRIGFRVLGTETFDVSVVVVRPIG
jgi:hypothetical protein